MKRNVQVSQYSSVPYYMGRYSSSMMHTILHDLLGLFTPFKNASASGLFLEVEKACTAKDLTKAVNKVQTYLFKMPTKEQTLPRKRLTNILSNQVLYAQDTALRLEAGQWLRFFVQAGMVSVPEGVFVTLVTGAVHACEWIRREGPDELQGYLKMIFDCFWPFRHPYAVFTWEFFPANEVFYPLVPLLHKVDISIQELLLTIFAELPELDDLELADGLLPIALAWSTHDEADHRRLVTNILARINRAGTRDALRRLKADEDVLVRSSAERAEAYVRGA